MGLSPKVWTYKLLSTLTIFMLPIIRLLITDYSDDLDLLQKTEEALTACILGLFVHYNGTAVERILPRYDLLLSPLGCILVSSSRRFADIVKQIYCTLDAVEICLHYCLFGLLHYSLS